LQEGDAVKAQEWFHKAFAYSPDKIFPNRLEDVTVLKAAIAVNDKDHKAYYYLGNFYYAKRRYEDARESWERSIGLFAGFATAHRNLGIAYFNKFNKKEAALRAFETAFRADPSDSRVLFELDQLYKRFNKAPQERLHLLNDHLVLVKERDDLYNEYTRLHVLTGEYDTARQLLASRNFHPWEGGEGQTSAQHILVHIELAKAALKKNQVAEAILLLKQAEIYPDNLGEGKLYGARENDIHYWLGCAYEQLNDYARAKTYWTAAATGPREPEPAFFYNDQQPDKLFYQGLALLRLGDEAGAQRVFANLVAYSEQHLNKEIKMDFFAVSLPDLMIFDDDLDVRNNINCYYLAGLGNLGAGNLREAENNFDYALALDPAHTGCRIHRSMLLMKQSESGEVLQE
jgi:tetratricopeptide (TPR) repeat protein